MSGRNFTQFVSIEHKAKTIFAFSLTIKSMIRSGWRFMKDYLTFREKHFFYKDDHKVLCCMNLTLNDWESIKAFINKVHKPVCGHAQYSDFKTLLSRNELWSKEIEFYLISIGLEFGGCRAIAQHELSRSLGISSLSRHFNDVVTVDHFCLGEICLFYCMDYATRFSAVHVVPSPKLRNAVIRQEPCCFNQFWHTKKIQGDNTFHSGDFLETLNQLNIPFRPLAPGLHWQNPIESNHSIIRSIFQRLRESG